MASDALPEDTSASQLVTWVMCPRKYLFRYVLKVEPEFRSVSLVLSSALRSAIGWFFQERLEDRSPRPDQAEAIFEADFAAEVSEGNILWKTKSEDEVTADGQARVRSYLERFSNLPVVAVDQPFRAGVEDPDTGETLPRALKGYFDLVLEDGTVVKLLTASRAPNLHDLVRHLHLGAYIAAKCVLDGGPVEVMLHVLAEDTMAGVHEHHIERGEPGNRWWFRAAMDIERAILSGHYPPSPGPLCRDCEYGRRCETWTGDARESRDRFGVAQAHA